MGAFVGVREEKKTQGPFFLCDGWWEGALLHPSFSHEASFSLLMMEDRENKTFLSTFVWQHFGSLFCTAFWKNFGIFLYFLAPF